MTFEYWMVGLVVLVTHCLEGITGFGCTALALPFVVMLIGVKSAVPVLVVLAWLLAGYVVFRSRKKIRWREYGFILLYTGLGVPAGIALFRYLPPDGLKLLLAAVMVAAGTNGIWNTLHTSGSVSIEKRTWFSIGKRVILVGGGIFHGAFGSGGPLVVVYAARALPEKSLFRVTTCLLWLTLNSILIIQWTLAGNVWTSEIGWLLLYTLPFLILGALAGDFLHHRTCERHFKLLVYGILILSAIGMIFS